MPQKYVVRGVRRPDGEPYRKLADDLQRIAIEEMQDAADEGLEEAQDYVRQAGTGTSWHPSGFPDLKPGQNTGGRRYAPSPGRMNTGHMLRALSSQVSVGSTVQARVGWLYGMYEDYFGYQDEGFTASGYRKMRQDVEGMGLMAYMRAWFKIRSSQAADDIVRRSMNGL